MLANNKQKGDTIVEVLIALAVLSLAFVISYATANSALIAAQNAQEHSLALEYIDAQLQALRYVATQPNQTLISQKEFNAPKYPNSAFCLEATGSGVDISNYFTAIVGNKSSYPNSAPVSCSILNGSFHYYIAIEPQRQIKNTFTVDIWWQGLGSLGIQQEQLSYRVYDD